MAVHVECRKKTGSYRQSFAKQLWLSKKQSGQSLYCVGTYAVQSVIKLDSIRGRAHCPL